MTSEPMPGIEAVAPGANVPAMPAMLNCVTLSAWPSGSLSLASTLPASGVSSGVVALSGAAAGASLTGVTLIVSVEVVVAMPSLSV